MSSNTRIWGLLDDRAGHANQVRGLLDAMPFSSREIALSYNAWSRLPNALLGATLKHLDRSIRHSFCAPWPDMVVACGRRTEPVARFIKRQNPATKIVYIMTPSSFSEWDALIIPSHDTPPKNDPRIIETLGPLHRITPALLQESHAVWQERFAPLPPPRIGVLLGDTSLALAEQMLERAVTLAGEQGSLLISNSRRTISGLLQALLRTLSVSNYAFDWHHPQGDNPYLGILAYADTLLVSGDSLSMCVEACASGKPVFIAADSALPAKHKTLHAELFARGFAVPIDSASTHSAVWHTNETYLVADRLAHLLES